MIVIIFNADKDVWRFQVGLMVCWVWSCPPYTARGPSPWAATIWTSWCFLSTFSICTTPCCRRILRRNVSTTCLYDSRCLQIKRTRFYSTGPYVCPKCLSSWRDYWKPFGDIVSKLTRGQAQPVVPLWQPFDQNWLDYDDSNNLRHILFDCKILIKLKLNTT